MASWANSDDTTHLSNHTTYATLSDPEKAEYIHQLHAENTRLKSEISHLKEKIIAEVNKDGVTVKEDLRTW